ncbi:AMP-binding protein [Cumulibacter manganitolerans]|uniref:AMP-binding protein n=1 Tax=Cumulibacter manganitolerans TaxID=1884992 RepID=UPI0012965DE5|nr:AMP-binding protein [Cumulibacter manganitolerans]
MPDSTPIQVMQRDLVLNAFSKFAGKPALAADGRTWTYGEIAAQANRVANALIAQGIRPGDRVALMMSNCAEYIIAEQGILRAGAALVALNDMLSDDERRYILRDSNAKTALATRSQVGPAMEVLAEGGELARVVLVADDQPAPEGAELWSDVLAAAGDGLPDVRVEPSTIARIAYTGGTTGQPKGAIHTQYTIGICLLAHLPAMALAEDEVLLVTSPLPHAAGFLLNASMLGGTFAYIERGFDLDVVLDRIEKDGASFLFMVPTMIYRMLDRVAAEQRDLSSLRTILYGAAPITVDRLAQGMQLLGPVFLQLYGQTECPNWITRLGKTDHSTDPQKAHLLRSCGRSTALVQVRIVDENDADVPVGEPGEIVLRSPYQMVGYHNRDEATAKTLRGGWLHTGDMGTMDADGYVYLVDRKNDMIISGGMNVYSTAVENAISAQDGVTQVAVVGVEHPDWGEAVVAYVVAAEGVSIDERSIIDGARDKLAKYELPKAVVQTEELPVTSVGKIDKKRLRAAWPGWDR